MPTVYVGTTVLDALVVTLDPPKVDWDDFHDLALAAERSPRVPLGPKVVG